MTHRLAARRRLIAAIRAYQTKHGSSPATRTLAQLLGYSQTGICYALRAAERDGEIQIDRSGYRHKYILKERP